MVLVMALLLAADRYLETKVSNATDDDYVAFYFDQLDGEFSLALAFDPKIYLTPKIEFESVNASSLVDRLLLQRRVSLSYKGTAFGQDASYKISSFTAEIKVGLFGMWVSEIDNTPSITMWN